MKISIELDGLHEGKNYVFEFSISDDGQVKKTTRKSSSKVNKEKKGPTLEDFEKKIDNKNVAPSLKEPNIKREFAIESSFDGKIYPS